MGIRGAWQRVGDGEMGVVVFVGIVLCLAKVLAELGGGVEEVGTCADKLGLIHHEVAARGGRRRGGWLVVVIGWLHNISIWIPMTRTLYCIVSTYFFPILTHLH